MRGLKKSENDEIECSLTKQTTMIKIKYNTIETAYEMKTEPYSHSPRSGLCANCRPIDDGSGGGRPTKGNANEGHFALPPMVHRYNIIYLLHFRDDLNTLILTSIQKYYRHDGPSCNNNEYLCAYLLPS